MKKNIHFILIFLFPLGLWGQQIPQNSNQTGDKGLKQGKWTILYDADWKVITDEDKAEFYRTITYKDSKPIGKVTDWYKNGKPQMVADSLIQEEPAQYEGGVILYRIDGSKESMQVFQNGKVIKQIYYNLDGSIAEESWQSLNQKGLELYQKGKYIEAIAILEKAKIQAEKENGKKHLIQFRVYMLKQYL